MAEGLVGGEDFAVDASLVKADASHQRQREDDDDWGSGRAVREQRTGRCLGAPDLSNRPGRQLYSGTSCWSEVILITTTSLALLTIIIPHCNAPARCHRHGAGYRRTVAG